MDDDDYCTCTEVSFKDSHRSRSESRRSDSCSESKPGHIHDDSFCTCTEISFKGSHRSESKRSDNYPDSKPRGVHDESFCTCTGISVKDSYRSPSRKSDRISEGRDGSIRDGSVKAGSVRSPRQRSILSDGCSCHTKGDSIRGGSIKEGSVRPESVKCESVKGDSIRGGSVKEGSIKGGSVKGDSIRGGSVKEGSIKGGSVKDGSIRSSSHPRSNYTGECSCSGNVPSVQAPSIKSYESATLSLQPILDPHCDPDNPRMLTYDMIRLARKNIEGAVLKTPLTKSKLSDLYGMNIFLKNEFLQYTGSFKERGARNALVNMPPEQQRKGAISASAGNHALALCYHGQQLDVPVTVVMPVTAPIMKIQNCRAFGAEIIVQGRDLGEAKMIAQNLAKDRGALYINGYDHIDVLAGQGTLGIEVLEQLPSATVVVIPAGGGGLIAGMAVAIKTLKPCTKVIGVESENCPSFANSLKAGQPVLTTTLPTVADGLAVPLPGCNAIYTAKNYVDKMIIVKEDDIAVSVLRLIEKEKFIVEGAGATVIAAIASGQLDEFKGKNVVAVLSGGNIDSTVLGRVLERGLAADGRFLKVYVTVSDRPGGVSELIRLISSIGVSIKSVSQERRWILVDVFSVMVKVVCETRDWDHALELNCLLKEHYENVSLVHVDFPPSTRTGKMDLSNI